MKNFLIHFSRIFVGLVFLFSSFVKGVDPLGTAYQIEDYFTAFGMPWAHSLSLFLSISLSTLEFLLGVALILKLQIKKTAWAVLLMMDFFIILTFYNAITDTVTDCACFGDAVKMSNWGTFFKNVILLFFTYIVFHFRKELISKRSNNSQWIAIIAIILIFVSFSTYQYRHLPMIDFRQWKVGADITPSEEGPDKYFVTYKNKKTGQTKEYLSPDYPWDDEIWMSEWEFSHQRIEKWKRDKTYELVIEDFSGRDLTKPLLVNGGYRLIIVARDLDKLDVDIFREFKETADYLSTKGYFIMGLTNSSIADYAKFRSRTGFRYQFYQADEVILKSMVRANPGLILVKDRKIIDKWNFNDYPGIPE